MVIISEIIGCNLKYDYKPSNAEAMELVGQNVDIVACAKHCLDFEEKCDHGWVYHAGNRKVGRISSRVEPDWSTSLSRTVPRSCLASSLMPY